MASVSQTELHIIEELKWVKILFNDPRAALFWMPIRLWLGWQWLQAADDKLDDPAWMKTGTALKHYWEGSVVVSDTGSSPIAYGWYRDFIQILLDAEVHTWFAKLVVYGELLVGIALILGAFTGIAAFWGGFMNWNFMLAGTTSTNPIMFAAALGLILAWKVCGYIGTDYFLLPTLGTPWGKWKNPGEAGNADTIGLPAAAGN